MGHVQGVVELFHDYTDDPVDPSNGVGAWAARTSVLQCSSCLAVASFV